MSVYDRAFFDLTLAGMRSSAAAVVPLLMDLYAPASVVDVGCGEGAWLAAFAEEGVMDILGLDGAWIDPARLHVPLERFRAVDLGEPVVLERRYDLAICIEVAEHLPGEAADTLVQTLVAASDRIVFSAAPPGQGGLDHVNEQPPEYWRERFARHGYEMIDNLRWPLWDDARIDWWYRQNLVTIARASAVEAVMASSARRFGETPRLGFIPAVHPQAHLGLRMECDALRKAASARPVTADPPGRWSPEVERLTEQLAEARARAESLEPEVERLAALAQVQDVRLAELTAQSEQQGVELEAARASLTEYQTTKTDWWDPEIERLTALVRDQEAALASGRAEHDRLAADVQVRASELEAAQAAIGEYEATKTRWWDPEIARLTALVEELQAAALTSEAAAPPVGAAGDFEAAQAVEQGLRAEVQALEARLAELEPELAALKEAARHARRMVVDHNDRLRLHMEEKAALRADFQALQQVVDTWFRPELERLEGMIQGHLQPELYRLQASIDDHHRPALEAMTAAREACETALQEAQVGRRAAESLAQDHAAALRLLQSSRGFRFLSRCRRVAENPVLRPVTGPLRRVLSGPGQA